MRNEINNTKIEFHSSTEYLSPSNDYNLPQGEFSIPQGEFSICKSEFMDTLTPEEETDTASGEAAQQKKKKQKKRHSQLIRKMSYMVASTVAIATLSQTLNIWGTIRENILSLGGSVNGDLRFSIQWNDKDRNPNDFDAHCTEPSGYDIYYGNREMVSPSGGTLDVDIVHPETEAAVENIVYPDKYDMEEGTYLLYVHCFSDNGGKSGFQAEIAFGGQTYHFDYGKRLRQGERILVAEITLYGGRFTIKQLIH